MSSTLLSLTESIELSGPALSGSLSAWRVHAFGEICGEYKSVVEIQTSDINAIDQKKIIGSKVSVNYIRKDADNIFVHDMICFNADMDYEHDLKVYSFTLELRPAFELLGLTENLEVFTDVKPAEVIRSVLERHEFTQGTDFTFEVSGNYRKQSTITQYFETDLQFIRRVCEQFGLFYAIDVIRSKPHFVLTDHLNGLRTGVIDTMAYQGGGLKRGITEFRHNQRLTPKALKVSGYLPYRERLGSGATVQAEPGGYGHQILHDRPILDPDAPENQANRLAQRLTTDADHFLGSANDHGPYAGCHLTMTDHPVLGEYDLVILRHETVTTFPRTEQGLTEATDVVSRFVAIGADASYRAPRRTPRPRIDGVIPGIVVGADNPTYAVLDDKGRYAVRPLFRDTGNETPPDVYPAVRLMQPHAGVRQGMHFPLRPGTEVVLAFVDGHPDQPLIVGAMANMWTPNVVRATNSRRNVMAWAGGAYLEVSDEGMLQASDLTPKAYFKTAAATAAGTTGDDKLWLKLLVPYAPPAGTNAYFRMGQPDGSLAAETAYTGKLSHVGNCLGMLHGVGDHYGRVVLSNVETWTGGNVNETIKGNYDAAVTGTYKVNSVGDMTMTTVGTAKFKSTKDTYWTTEGTDYKKVLGYTNTFHVGAKTSQLLGGSNSTTIGLSTSTNIGAKYSFFLGGQMSQVWLYSQKRTWGWDKSVVFGMTSKTVNGLSRSTYNGPGMSNYNVGKFDNVKGVKYEGLNGCEKFDNKGVGIKGENFLMWDSKFLNAMGNLGIDSKKMNMIKSNITNYL